MTSHPARLYDGKVVERIDPETLDGLVRDLVARKGPLRVGAGRMGVFTWDLTCESDEGPFVLQVPLVLDEPGRRGRAKRDVPRLNVENARHYIAAGLTRFVSKPLDSLTLPGGIPAALFSALPQHFPLTFGRGALELKLPDGWLTLGPSASADLLAEMIAALVYHYEPNLQGGTALCDVFVNDGDFAVRRASDGSFDLKLTAARKREPGIGPNLLLLYLVQLMAYEDWSVDGNLTGLPVLVSNPSVAFEGVVRGLEYRQRDLGQKAGDGASQARQWIADFGRSREGRGYRLFTDAFLAGELAPRFGDDLRERWWRLSSVQHKLCLLELRARLDPSSSAAESARTLKTFLDRLTHEIGQRPAEAAPFRFNDLGREELAGLLAEANVAAPARADVAAEIFAHWPYRSLDQLVARVPAARGFRRLKSRLSFGRLLGPAEQGTLKNLGPLSKHAGPARPFANPELFGAFCVAPSLEAAAVRTFPTFEAYMDAALFDESWGYYAHRVVIGREGHFDTHPEEQSPHYGRWLSRWAFKAWCDLLEHGELTETEAFSVIEFGAGNGRLARDFLDAIADATRVKPAERERFRVFASRVEYRIYDMSSSLREKQRELVGDRAVVAEGDARRPGETLKRDFPNGLKGFVVTNEVPDAFGFHKVVLTAEGQAFAALVVPRLERALAAVLGTELWERVAVTDADVRRSFGFDRNVEDCYLDHETFGAVMAGLAELPAAERDRLLDGLWFEELYVPAPALPELALHLCANSAQYATALAAENTGVVLYVNVHANRFISELGASLGAGFVVTIDYGDSTFNLVQGARRGDFPFRVYGDWQEYVPRPNDPYVAPGTQDMTADVNFSDLARAGQASGLALIHFGPERDLIGEELPEVVRAAAEGAHFTKLLENQAFKVLVLGTRPSSVFASLLSTPLLLFSRPEDVAKSRREKIASIEQALRTEEQTVTL